MKIRHGIRHHSARTGQPAGSVTLVGFGPGDPDLLTLGGDKALRAADVIFHDRMVSPQFLARYAAEKVHVGKRRGDHTREQDEINALLLEAARAGKRAVRLKGGDPMIFGRGREEIDFLEKHGVEVRVIPGVSSGVALASLTGIPLTHRGLSTSVAFVSGHAGRAAQTPQADTLVYYMAGSNAAEIAETLVAAGRPLDTPVALVSRVSLPDQQTFFTFLGELRFSAQTFPTPVLIVVGEVVSLESGAPAARKTRAARPPRAASSRRKSLSATSVAP